MMERKEGGSLNISSTSVFDGFIGSAGNVGTLHLCTEITLLLKLRALAAGFQLETRNMGLPYFNSNDA